MAEQISRPLGSDPSTQYKMTQPINGYDPVDGYNDDKRIYSFWET